MFLPLLKGIQEAFERVRSSDDLQTGRIELVGWYLPLLVSVIALLQRPCPVWYSVPSPKAKPPSLSAGRSGGRPRLSGWVSVDIPLLMRGFRKVQRG